MNKKFADEITETPFLPVLDSALSTNHVSVGGSGGRSDFQEKKELEPSFPVENYYNPHNARFYFKFDKTNLKFKKSFKISNGYELVRENFQGCRIVIKKVQVEVTNIKDPKRIFIIKGSVDERKELVEQAKETIKNEAIEVLKAFVSLYGGSSDFKVLKSWIPDNKVSHEKIIDKIPVDFTFRNDVAKKVYLEPPVNVEFATPAHASNYFRNAGLYDYAPMIANAIDETNMHLEKVSENLLKTSEETKNMAYNASSHIALVREAKDSINNLTGVVLQLRDVIIKLESKEPWIKKLWKKIKSLF